MSSSAEGRKSPVGVGVGLDTSEGRAFVHERLALLGKVIFLLAGSFWMVGFVASIFLAPHQTDRPESTRAGWAHLTGALTMGALWLSARRGNFSLRALGLLDAGATLLTCFAWAAIIETSPEDVYVAMLASMATVTARAAVVPSSAKRTFWLTTVALLPIIAGAAYKPPGGAGLFMGVLGAVLWNSCAIACATVTSNVIYGLRQRVKEAMELGQYTLEQKIGSGGMGEVWRARHRFLIRPAAIKLIRPQPAGSPMADPELLHRRFEREARATAALRSPHTVQLYDFGITDDGTLYYVMELLEGFNLEQLVERFGPVPAERAVHILDQACRSLADAHANGLVHRDIKPANIFVSRSGLEVDFVKVLDFGLVKLDAPVRGEEATRLSTTGTMTGTPAFMAPETVLGEEKSDHRVDIYSLGCVAYWMLTGQLVFEGATVMKVMLDHASSEPRPPSTRVELAIPPALEELVLCCLAKEPAKRPATAAELSARLRASVPPGAWTPERAASWWSAHAPALGESRPVADVLLSQEARPPARVQRPGTRS